MEQRDDFWYWFVNIPLVGCLTQNKLLERFGTPEAVYEAGEKMLSGLLTEKQLAAWKHSHRIEECRKQLEKLEKNGIQFIHRDCTQYPKGFGRLYDAPCGFYLKGRLPDESRPVVAMVGARNATVYGREMAARFAEAFVKKGIQVVSGLAAGVDAASHRGALREDGYTLGVLGGGIDTIYPRSNFNLYMEMYRKGGVLSEYNCGVPNQPGLFPVRNRLISALSDGVFVVEAGEKSGSLITADQALEQGKEVFALPGRITDKLSIGCNRLISEGAFLVQEPEDVVEILERKSGKERENRFGGKKTGKTKYFEAQFDNEEQKMIFHLLDEKTPTSFNEILAKTRYNFADLQYILLEMELRGWIYQSAQNDYLKRF